MSCASGAKCCIGHTRVSQGLPRLHGGWATLPHTACIQVALASLSSPWPWAPLLCHAVTSVPKPHWMCHAELCTWFCFVILFCVNGARLSGHRAVWPRPMPTGCLAHVHHWGTGQHCHPYSATPFLPAMT